MPKLLPSQPFADFAAVSLASRVTTFPHQPSGQELGAAFNPRDYQGSPVAPLGPLIAAESPPPPRREDSEALTARPQASGKARCSKNPAEPVLQVCAPSNRPGIPKGCIRANMFTCPLGLFETGPRFLMFETPAPITYFAYHLCPPRSFLSSVPPPLPLLGLWVLIWSFLLLITFW